MATVSERLALIIDFKGDAAIKGLEGAARKAEGADESTRKLSGNLTKMGATGLAASGIAAVGLSKLAMGASDLNEVTSKSRVLFGEASEGVEKFAEGAARSLGQSKAAALEAATTFANLGRATGLGGEALATFSEDLVTLSGDLASFNNTSPEEAVMALGAALRGESEPIRAYGVMLDDATLKQRALSMGLIDTTTGTLPPAIKMQAAYAEIMAQTSAAQGDFARTADGAANQQRILKAEIKNLADGIGVGLLPAFNAVVKGASGVVGKLNELSPAAKSAIGTLAAGGVGVTAAVSGISLIAAQVIKLKERMTDAEGGLNLAGKVAVGSAIGIGVFSTALGVLQFNSDRSKANLNELQAAMAKTGKTAELAASQLLFEWIAKNKDAAKVLKDHKISNEDLIAVMGGDVAARKRVIDVLQEEMLDRETWIGTTRDESTAARDLIVKIKDLTGAREDSSKESAAAVTAEKAVTEATGGSRKGLSEHRRAVQDDIDAVDDRTKAQEQAKRVEENAKRAADELTKALEAQKKADEELLAASEALWGNKNLDMPEAIDAVRSRLFDFYDAQKDAATATKEHGAESMEAQRALIAQNEAARSVTESIRGVAEVALATAENQAKMEGRVLTATEKVAIQKAALEQLKADNPSLSASIDAVGTSFDGLAAAAEDAGTRITAAMALMVANLKTIFNSLDIGNGLSMIVATADRMDAAAAKLGGVTPDSLAAASRIHGSDAMQRAIGINTRVT